MEYAAQSALLQATEWVSHLAVSCLHCRQSLHCCVGQCGVRGATRNAVKSWSGLVCFCQQVKASSCSNSLACSFAAGDILAAIPKSVCFETEAPTEAVSALAAPGVGYLQPCLCDQLKGLSLMQRLGDLLCSFNLTRHSSFLNGCVTGATTFNSCSTKLKGPGMPTN